MSSSISSIEVIRKVRKRHYCHKRTAEAGISLRNPYNLTRAFVNTFYSIQRVRKRAMRVLIRLREGAGWSEQSLPAFVRMALFPCWGPNIYSIVAEHSCVNFFETVSWKSASRAQREKYCQCSMNYIQNRGTQTRTLTLSTLGKIFSRRHIEIFLLFFPENRIWHFIQMVSNGDHLHEMSNPVFCEK